MQLQTAHPHVGTSPSSSSLLLVVLTAVVFWVTAVSAVGVRLLPGSSSSSSTSSDISSGWSSRQQLVLSLIDYLMKTLEHRQCRGVQWSLPAGLTQCREELRLPGSCTTPSPRAQNKRLLLRWGTGTPFWCEGAGPGARWARSTPWSKVTNQTTRSRRSPW